jgi:hypothetical protein
MPKNTKKGENLPPNIKKGMPKDKAIMGKKTKKGSRRGY